MALATDIANIFLQNDTVQQDINVKIENAVLQSINKHPFLKALIEVASPLHLTTEELTGTIKVPLLKSGKNVQRVRQGSKYERNTISQHEAHVSVNEYAYPLILQQMIMDKLKDAEKDAAQKMREFSPHVSNHYNTLFEEIFEAIESDLMAETPQAGGVLNLASFTDGSKSFMGIDGTQTGYEYWTAATIDNTMTPAQLMQLVATDATKTVLYEEALMELFDAVSNKGRIDFIALGSNLFKLLRRSATVRDSGAWRVEDGVIRFEGRTFAEARGFKKNIVRGFDSRYLIWAENRDHLSLSSFKEQEDYHKTYISNCWYSCACYSNRRETCGQITFTNIPADTDVAIP